MNPLHLRYRIAALIAAVGTTFVLIELVALQGYPTADTHVQLAAASAPAKTR